MIERFADPETERRLDMSRKTTETGKQGKKGNWLLWNPFDSIWTYIFAIVAFILLLIPILYVGMDGLALIHDIEDILQKGLKSFLHWEKWLRRLVLAGGLLLITGLIYRYIKSRLHRTVPSLCLSLSLSMLSASVFMRTNNILFFRDPYLTDVTRADTTKWVGYSLIITSVSTLIGEAAKNVWYNAGGLESDKARASGHRFKQQRRVLLFHVHSVMYWFGGIFIAVFLFALVGFAEPKTNSTNATDATTATALSTTVPPASDTTDSGNSGDGAGENSKAADPASTLFGSLYMISAALGLLGFVLSTTASDEELLRAEKHYLISHAKSIEHILKKQIIGKRTYPHYGKRWSDYCQVFANFCCSRSGIRSQSFKREEVFEEVRRILDNPDIVCKSKAVADLILMQYSTQKMYVDGQYPDQERMDIEGQFAEWIYKYALGIQSPLIDDSVVPCEKALWDAEQDEAYSPLRVFRTAAECMFEYWMPEQYRGNNTIEDGTQRTKSLWGRRLSNIDRDNDEITSVLVLQLLREVVTQNNDYQACSFQSCPLAWQCNRRRSKEDKKPNCYLDGNKAKSEELCAYLLVYPYAILHHLRQSNPELFFLSKEVEKEELGASFEYRTSETAAVEHYYFELFKRAINKIEQDGDFAEIVNRFRQYLIQYQANAHTRSEKSEKQSETAELTSAIKQIVANRQEGEETPAAPEEADDLMLGPLLEQILNDGEMFAGRNRFEWTAEENQELLQAPKYKLRLRYGMTGIPKKPDKNHPLYKYRIRTWVHETVARIMFADITYKGSNRQGERE